MLARAALVLLTVKSAGTEVAARDLLLYAAPAAPIISFQNGVDNVDRLRAALPGRTVLAGMVPFNVTAPEPGRFHQGTSGALALESHPAVERWAAKFARAGLPLDLRTDMTATAWAKLLLNLNNAINALSGLSLAAELAQRDYRRALALAQEEALSVLDRAGIRPARLGPLPPRLMPTVLRLPDRLFRFVAARSTPAIDAEARSSMADDLALRRTTEVDQINGAVVATAAKLSISAPVNAELVRLVHLAEQGATFIPADVLLERVVVARAVP